MNRFFDNHVDRLLASLLVVGLWVFIFFGHIGEAQTALPNKTIDVENLAGLENFIQEIVEDCEVMVLNLGVSTMIDCS